MILYKVFRIAACSSLVMEVTVARRDEISLQVSPISLTPTMLLMSFKILLGPI